jgi:hypothetical protein
MIAFAQFHLSKARGTQNISKVENIPHIFMPPCVRYSRFAFRIRDDAKRGTARGGEETDAATESKNARNFLLLTVGFWSSSSSYFLLYSSRISNLYSTEAS